MRTLAILALFALANAASPQNPLTPGYTPAQLSAQLPRPLYVRIAGPPGMKVTFYRGQATGITLEAPFVVGLRPGYVYRLSVTGIGLYPSQVFYPSLEVRGSLFLAGNLKTSDYPASLVFSDEDFNKVQNGSLVKKVILLEKTDGAFPQATKPDQPLEFTAPPNRDPLYEARERGLPLVIFLMGQRDWTKEELAEQGVPGTILLPGEKVLPAPRRQPWMPWACYPIYDPLAGPAPPWPYYSLNDGGDTGQTAGVDPRGRVRGVDPSDTVASYQDSKGNQRLAVSNRVSLLVPRFVVAKGEVMLSGRGAKYGPGGYQATSGQFALNGSMSIHGQQLNQHLESARDHQRLSGTDNLFGTTVTGRSQGVDLKGTLAGPKVIDGSKNPPGALEPTDGPLKIIKWPDKTAALVGDVVTFFLKYTNTGGQPITTVAVTDSLITRYEYVPGSARADREASFTTQPNEAGSLTLRWEFSGTLLPRESGLVSFQVKIR